MHLSTSYDTGPSACRWSAVVGQAETQAGSRQWRHRRITKAESRPPGFCAFSSSWNEMSVYVFALSVAGFWKPSWSSSSVSSPSFSFHCLQATWHARQPMQLAMSISVVLIGPVAAVSVMRVPSVNRIFARPGDRP